MEKNKILIKIWYSISKKYKINIENQNITFDKEWSNQQKKTYLFESNYFYFGIVTVSIEEISKLDIGTINGIKCSLKL
jgi:hypothetical protein